MAGQVDRGDNTTSRISCRIAWLPRKMCIFFQIMGVDEDANIILFRRADGLFEPGYPRFVWKFVILALQ